MAIIGELIKRVIDVGGIISKNPSPEGTQLEVLLKLLTKAKDTAFGRKFKFADLLQQQDITHAFQEAVPIYDYDTLYEHWWHYLEEGHENITWPGGQRFFALSSGTTSTSKAIPVTMDMLDSIKQAGIQQILSLHEFDLPADFFERDIMMLGSSTNLRDWNGFLAGEISGISAANLPLWFRRFYKPGKKIAASADWDERVRLIAKSAAKWDIGSMTGIPSWSEILLKEIVRYHGVNSIHDIWPNLRVYTTGGVAFGPYRKSFETLFARPMVYIDTYLASEGYLATQKRPNAEGMALITDNGIFFEFVPFEPEYMDKLGRVKPDAPALTLAEVEENQEYVLLISTVAGAWRYMIGDTVMFTDRERAEIRITGRTKHFLNVVGEQLSVHQMNHAIEMVEERFNLPVREFTVASIRSDGHYINRWYLGVDCPVESVDLSSFLDEQLMASNKNYAVARRQTLDRIEVILTPTERFYQWNASHKRLGGQTKIPRVMDGTTLAEFEQFLATS
ncbi:GH3 family domain-containing protein [Sphingobacterium suaedae]|uniref:GH3 auxin-responsive promoter family protein n=1 Tax=Sphingobacterium suaedae TaxID=1686402 RepID=A0ABW5KD79_9SPHI